MSAFFVTATGTDIGKTFVTAGLIRLLRAGGRAVEALKPVITGFDPNAPERSDAGALLAALGLPLLPAEIDRISPWRYTAPLAPNMAARREGRPLDFDRLVEFSQNAASRARGTLLIEGIGGVMVPLDDTRTVLDWIVALRMPLLLVTGSYLGSISHTLTCIDVLQRRGLAIKALVVNETPGSTVTMDDTVKTLAHFAPSIPLVALPRLATTATDHAAFAEIAKPLTA